MTQGVDSDIKKLYLNMVTLKKEKSFLLLNPHHFLEARTSVPHL